MAKRKGKAREISEYAWRTREKICMGTPEVTHRERRKEHSRNPLGDVVGCSHNPVNGECMHGRTDVEMHEGKHRECAV